MDDPLSQIPPTTLGAQVVDRLRNAILKGKFAPGSQLNQVKVARMFGTSRGPVREALRKLEEEGLVRNIPHRGTHVAPLDRKTVNELYRVRSILEAYAVKTSIPLCQKEDLEIVRGIIEKMQAAAADEETEAVIDYDFQIHEFFVRRTQNSVLMQTWSNLKVQVLRALSFRHHSYPRLQEIADSHLPLIKIMETHDAAEGARFMEAHIQDACDDLMKRWTLDSSPE